MGTWSFVIAEGAGQDRSFFLNPCPSRTGRTLQETNYPKMLGCGYLSEDQGILLTVLPCARDHFTKQKKMITGLVFSFIWRIRPTYMIRAIPSNASDNLHCTLLAHSAIHGAMAGYTGFTVGQVNGRHAYIPFYAMTGAWTGTLRKLVKELRAFNIFAILLPKALIDLSFLLTWVIERQNKVVITDRMRAWVLSSTNQPSFLDPRCNNEAKKDEPATTIPALRRGKWR
ncbi:ATP-dependent 6-phosphofructokinase 7-like [Rhododendron vialii]|uniref:ATP-dependent 6-phosphofructokinase 7-like n=1 Tax=Rhododendron vialii TaxID=182163 RepID=UPI00265DA980|nr:ATP-dependent 6-phosphofructokinase 7-like [Rhododendron vialii]